MMRRIAKILLLAIAIAIGCDRDPVPPAANAPPTFGTATVTGRIRFIGPPVERRMIDLSTCRDGAPPYQEETIVVGDERALRDVIVYLKDAPPSDGASQPALTLDQVDCRYVPHVLAVQVGQPVKIQTSDTCFHNVHWTSDHNGDVNFGLTRPGESKTVTFSHPEFIRLRCDVHAWMDAYIGVVPSPFFAVSAADGRFTIARVPAGKYTLVTWHPLVGERHTSVEVGAGETQTVTINYGPPVKP